MKQLTVQEIKQVSGAGIVGSALGKSSILKTLGLGNVVKSINDFENKMLEDSIGKVPGIGETVVDLLRDPFGSFK